MRPFRARRSSLLISVMVAVATTTVTAGFASASTSAPSDTVNYVALGDSYSAGSGVPPSSSDAPSPLCLQSAVDYPHVLAAHQGFQLADVTCGGATVSNMASPQYLGMQPQFSALHPDTSVVTIGIGGNDNGLFVSMVLECGLLDITSLPNPAAAPCQQLIGNSFASNINNDAPNIAAALQQIHQISPRAKVFVVGYPDVLPQTGSCYSVLPVSAGDAAFLNTVELTLNAMLRSQAEQNGATYVDTYTSSIGHDACEAAGVRWIEPFFGATGAAVVHPNAAGEAADASDIEAAMSSAGMSSTGIG